MRRTTPFASPRQCASANAIAKARSAFQGYVRSRRTRKRVDNRRGPFLPPETWHDVPDRDQPTYQVITQEAGPGYRHVVTAAEIIDRLGQLPEWALERLAVVQLSRMTRKKQLFPCYGMQWGNAIYLYPLEEGLVEEYDRPPKVAVYNETRMFGGRWEQLGGGRWLLRWSPESIRDFYLNNILIHELGHLLDDRNSRSIDRERFAEWFAIEHGYRPTHRARLARLAAERMVRRRHQRG